jgi:hypothetical protein
MRAPSLLRALVVRLTIVVVLALAGVYPILYFEFREGLMGLEGQSIAIQVQDLRSCRERTRPASSCHDPCVSSTARRVH